jgi:hypothetical protein
MESCIKNATLEWLSLRMKEGIVPKKYQFDYAPKT